MLTRRRLRRHEAFRDQFRAMFVTNVRVDETQLLRPADGVVKGDEGGGPYHPALCGSCGVELGVYEPEDELYVFFNVLATNA